VILAGRIEGLQHICGKKYILRDFLRFGFLIFLVIGQGFPYSLVIFLFDERTRLSLDLVVLYLLGGMVLHSEFLNLITLENINIVSDMC
jgi:hypothetical protein